MSDNGRFLQEDVMRDIALALAVATMWEEFRGGRIQLTDEAFSAHVADVMDLLRKEGGPDETISLEVATKFVRQLYLGILDKLTFEHPGPSSGRGAFVEAPPEDEEPVFTTQSSWDSEPSPEDASDGWG